jgi:uncharacterized membrane protein YfcA
MQDLSSWLPTVLTCIAALTLAGVVKGVISVGLPLVGLPLLMLAVDVQTAVSLLMVPLVLSNLLQAVEGEGTLDLLKRFWPLILCLVAGTFIGTALFARLDQHLLLLGIGSLAILFSSISILRPDLGVETHHERWFGPPIGLAAGIIGGMSTLFGPILSIYVVGLKLPRDVFVKAISLLYLIAAICLTLGGTAQGTAGWRQIALSALAMIPVYGGMLIGQRLREKIDPEQFRLLVLGVVWLTGVNMIRVGLGY